MSPHCPGGCFPLRGWQKGACLSLPSSDRQCLCRGRTCGSTWSLHVCSNCDLGNCENAGVRTLHLQWAVRKSAPLALETGLLPVPPFQPPYTIGSSGQSNPSGKTGPRGASGSLQKMHRLTTVPVLPSCIGILVEFFCQPAHSESGPPPGGRELRWALAREASPPPTAGGRGNSCSAGIDQRRARRKTGRALLQPRRRGVERLSLRPRTALGRRRAEWCSHEVRPAEGRQVAPMHSEPKWLQPCLSRGTPGTGCCCRRSLAETRVEPVESLQAHQQEPPGETRIRYSPLVCPPRTGTAPASARRPSDP